MVAITIFIFAIFFFRIWVFIIKIKKLMGIKQIIFEARLNWKSGFTVSLVAIPLSISLAVASHASPVVGILTAIWAGLIAALFGGSNYNVVGPTGALSGILAAYAIVHGSEALAMVAVLAGVIIYLAYVFRLHKYLVFVPGSAIHGFTLGVAFIIGLGQLNFALGILGLSAHEKFVENLLESAKHLGSASAVSAGLFLASLALLLFFKKAWPRIPGAIVLAPLGIILGGLFQSKPALAIPTLGSLYPHMGAAFFLPLKLEISQSAVVTAFAVALVAILETMISAKIADGMTGTRHSRRKEMRGLALANIASGFMGGMPATAALARTSLNIKTGATSRISSAISSMGVAVIALFFLQYFKFIPLAVIAAILVFVAIQMVEAEHFSRMFKHDRKNFYVSVLTAFVTVFQDPIVGILFGVGVSSLLLMEKLSRGQFDLSINNAKKQMVSRMSGDRLQKIVEGSDTIVYSIKGLLCYINSESHLNRFRLHLNGSRNIILRMRSVYYIDIDGVETVDEIIQILTSAKKNVYVTGVSPLISEMLSESQGFRQLKSTGRVFRKSSEVLRLLGFNLTS